ncbi:hypothetical protein [Streptomyces sp. CBMA123]|uniref:hypothetical protein n=1 Tax=Streptomyces sp. CBMA123 TaxID=1896313 RepID=UPI001661ED60|nr:hypothetical protein [Streptomyces sp. CBMA123]MBD0692433.1 hypothetical protein [Streptomyces sp. CBMA123]
MTTATATALTAHANTLRDQADRLPDVAPDELPDAVALGRQVAHLGSLINEMGHAFAFLSTVPSAPEHIARAAEAYTSAISHVSRASTQLSDAAGQIALIARTNEDQHLPWARNLRAKAPAVSRQAIAGAREELLQAVTVLNNTATVLPWLAAGRHLAAAHRSTAAPAPTAPTAPAPAAAAVHTTRHRR